MSAEKADVAKLSDEELVRMVRTDDSELYEEIVKRYQDRLYRYLRYLTNQPDASEDILQEVFIKAYRNLFGFNTKKKFSSWIYRIAHNEGVNHLKRTARRKYVSWEEVGTPVDGNDKLNSQYYGKQNSHGNGKQNSHKSGKQNSHSGTTPV